MNGYRDSPHRYVENESAISPRPLDSAPWGSDTISRELRDHAQNALRSLHQYRPSDRSAALFRQLPPEVIERYVHQSDHASVGMNRHWLTSTDAEQSIMGRRLQRFCIVMLTQQNLVSKVTEPRALRTPFIALSVIRFSQQSCHRSISQK